MREPAPLAGFVAAAAAAGAYGFTVVIGRDLALAGFEGAPVLATRFCLGAAILAVFQLARRSPVSPPTGERLRVAGLGCLYAVESSLFYAALDRGSAGAAALVFYCYPAVVATTELVLGSLRPSGRLAAALVLSVGGVLTVVAVEGDLTISTTGILFALGAALCFTAYLLSGDRLVTRTDPVVKALWVSAGAGVALAARAVVSGDALPPGDRLLELSAYGLANAAAFGCMFAALGCIGATRTAVVLNFEVVASVALAALLLSERLGPLQAVGGAAVVGGAVLAALVEGGDLVEEEAAPP